MSCVGEDVRNIDEQFTIAFNNTLFSIALDEARDEKLDVEPRLNINIGELPEDVRFTVSSTDEEVLTVDNGAKIRFSPVSRGETTLVLRAFAEEINDEGELAEVMIAQAEKEIIVGVQTLTVAEVSRLDNERARALAAEGFTEVELTNSVESIGLDTEASTILEAQLTDRNNETPEGAIFEWQSSDVSVLEVSSEGELTPIAEGTAVITATLTNPENFALNIGANLTTEITITVTPGAEVVVVIPEPDPIEEEDPLDSGVLGFGDFVGTGYRVTGSFEIINENGQLVVSLSDDFRTSRLPDLVIYLSNSEFSNSGALIIDDTIQASGAQSFVIPAGTDLNDYANVLLFCRAFGAPVGFGTIQR